MAEKRDYKDPDNAVHQPHRPKAKKDTKRWCKGKVGREHVREIAKTGYLVDRPCHESPSWWRGTRDEGWWCHHIWACENCGKHFEYVLKKDCPDWTPERESRLRSAGATDSATSS